MSTATNIRWQSVLDVIRSQLVPSQFETWFTKTNCLEFSDTKIVVEVPNKFYLEWLKRQYGSVISDAVEKTAGRRDGRQVTFVVTANGATGSMESNLGEVDGVETIEKVASRARDAEELVRVAGLPRDPELHLNPEYVFENFVVGSSNRLAHAASLAVVENAGRVYNPLFIHGGLGLGKTHLLQAICHNVLAKRPNLRLLYLPCEQFINCFITALERGQIEAFRQRYRMLDVLVIDDIHFLANKEHTQEEFFHTFNALYNDRKQIILSSDSPPKDIPNLEERLVSRFKWGLVAEIESPSFELRLAIIRKKSARFGIDVPDEVAEYLATNLKTSVRELEGAVTNLLGYASIMKESISLDTAKQVLGESLGPRRKRTTLDRIVTLVTEHYGVRLSDLQSKKRFQSIALPRQVCMYLARRYTNLSLAEIGGSFGGRDHSTVLYATEKIASRLDLDGELRSAIQTLSQALEA
jgi:chromosomal replication initiator protein